MKRIFLLLCFFLFSVYYIFTQETEPQAQQEVNGVETDSDETEETDAEEEVEEEPIERPFSPELSFIEMDIRTSSLMELAAWCRELGLNDGGSRDALAARLRAHYGIPPARPTEQIQRVIN